MAGSHSIIGYSKEGPKHRGATAPELDGRTTPLRKQRAQYPPPPAPPYSSHMGPFTALALSEMPVSFPFWALLRLFPRPGGPIPWIFARLAVSHPSVLGTLLSSGDAFSTSLLIHSLVSRSLLLLDYLSHLVYYLSPQQSPCVAFCWQNITHHHPPNPMSE